MQGRNFSKELKVQIVQELESGKPIEQIAREHEVHPVTIRRWKREYRQGGTKVFAGKGNMYKLEAKNAQLERTIGELYVENRFLKKALEKLEELVKEGK